uniref:Uncharacterized protein n=1 Tax=Poecilia mexicana TaxID=48701 RepID=A0A3B3WU88_9TELE
IHLSIFTLHWPLILHTDMDPNIGASLFFFLPSSFLKTTALFSPASLLMWSNSNHVLLNILPPRQSCALRYGNQNLSLSLKIQCRQICYFNLEAISHC